MGEARNFNGREIPVYGSVMVDTGYCTFVKNHIMYKTKSEVQSKAWTLVSKMYQYWFINYNKYITLM